jgi:hypothetical protein
MWGKLASMNQFKLICLILFISITLLASCKSDEEPPLNPNGDTELALLMRAMFDEGMDIKADIESGKHPEINLEHEKILTAEATQPEEAASPEFKSLANKYLFAVRQLGAKNNMDAGKKYDDRVQACMDCHRSMCPGPLERIKKLKRPE